MHDSTLAREVWTIDQVAETYQLSRRFVTKAIADGQLEVIRFGRAVRITPRALDAWISGHSTSRGADRD